MDGFDVVRVAAAWAVVWVATQALGRVARRFGQPGVVGEMAAGILLGPTLLGAVLPDLTRALFGPETLDVLRAGAHVGLVMFMFTVGLDADLAHVRHQAAKAVVVSKVSIIVPMGLGWVLADWLYPRFGGDTRPLAFGLFVATSMAITAFPVLARILQDLGLARTPVGTMAIACAAVDDVVAWVVLAVCVAVAEATAAAGAVWTIVHVGLFAAACIGLLRPALATLPAAPPWAAAALALAGGWVTEHIGVHAVFGAFLVGLAMPRTDAVERSRATIERVLTRPLLPLFFAVVGLSTRLGMLASGAVALAALAVLITAVAGKWAGCALASRATPLVRRGCANGRSGAAPPPGSDPGTLSSQRASVVSIGGAPWVCRSRGSTRNGSALLQTAPRRPSW